MIASESQTGYGSKVDGSAAERRRILVVLRWPVGGIRTYILYNYPTLVSDGYRFTFVGPADQSFDSFREELRDWDGAEFIGAPLCGRSCRLRHVVRKHLRSGRFGLVHSHGVIAAAEVGLANLGLGVPHVFTSHDVFRTEHVATLKGRIKCVVLGEILRRASAVISVTEEAKENLLEYLPRLVGGPCRLYTIQHGIDLGRIEASVAPFGRGLRVRLEIGPGVFLIGFLGRFMEQKGFLPLLHALKLLADGDTVCPFHLLAVGSGDFEGRYRAEAERLGLADRITFHDAVPDVTPILREIDLLVMPSLWEAAGILAMEAMATGVPVLGSDCIGLREVLHGSPSVMVTAGDVNSMHHALRRAVASCWKDAAMDYALEAKLRFDGKRSSLELRKVFDAHGNFKAFEHGGSR